VRQAFLDKEVGKDVQDFVKKELVNIIAAQDTALVKKSTPPTVVMISGINGSGKTTSIAKLTNLLQKQGNKVIVAACDTFRAAAVEQLTIWSQRLGCEIIKAPHQADPASVAHDAVSAALARKADYLLIDTAGRLHTQAHLMKELEKIWRIVSRQIPDAPHESILVLDATTGQNAVVQAQEFLKTVKCTGIILTKLDGTAKGGSIISIRQKLNLPVKFIGVGEGIDDMESFDAVSYVDGLFEEV
ncbi:MAG TPA: signal recognition particle-docking protein FtsY, partial [Gemmatales bacterium]|nr:signal recognition particle-docking protein FtsY [Gemmatales bacterium]